MEHSRNDGSKAQYYVVILDRLQDRSGGLERAPESWIRGPLTVSEKRFYEDVCPHCQACRNNLQYYAFLLYS